MHQVESADLPFILESIFYEFIETLQINLYLLDKTIKWFSS